MSLFEIDREEPAEGAATELATSLFVRSAEGLFEDIEARVEYFLRDV